VDSPSGVEKLRTVITVVGGGAQDCLVVDTFAFNFPIWCVVTEERCKREPRPGVAACRAAAQFCGDRFARLCVGREVAVSPSHDSDGEQPKR